MFGKLINERSNHYHLDIAVYYINLHFHYQSNFKLDDLKLELYMCIRILVKDVA